MRNAQAAAEQQAFAIHPVRLGQHVGDTFGQLQGACGDGSCINQQGKFITAQTGNLVAGIELVFQARYHLQNQPVTGLMPQRIVGVAEVVEVQMPQRQAAALCQTIGQQRLKTLTVGDAGQRILTGQTSQGVFQAAALMNVAQAAAQDITGQRVAHQPVADTARSDQRFLFQQHHGRQQAGSGFGQQVGRGQQHGIALAAVPGTENIPVRAMQQYHIAARCRGATVQKRLPERLVCQ
ncbi:hypothetical protein ALP75_203935 [Pseudomonas syringae pv. actinidiae]|nr:hypothetical protein ALP75_203935 [Pseudomonas syringae pv. actinidiae]